MSNEAQTNNEVRGDFRRRPPFTQVPDWLALAPISAQAFRLYVLLAGHVNQGRDDTDVWPTQQQLAEMLGLSKAGQVKPYADELISIGAVTRKQVRTHGRMRPRNIYTVLGTAPPDWDGPSSLAEFYDQRDTATKVDETGKPQVTPRHPNLGVSNPPKNGVWRPPQKGMEQDQQEQDQHQPSRPTAGAVGDGDAVSDEKHKNDQDEHCARSPVPISNGHEEAAADDHSDGYERAPDDERERARALLSSLRMPSGGPFNPHEQAVTAVATQLTAGYDDKTVTAALLHDVAGYRNPAAGVTANARGLGEALAHWGSHSGSQGRESVIPEWCGECEGPTRRFVEYEDGRVGRCPRCNPRHPNICAAA